jgi:hypothetical protein
MRQRGALSLAAAAVVLLGQPVCDALPHAAREAVGGSAPAARRPPPAQFMEYGTINDCRGRTAWPLRPKPTRLSWEIGALAGKNALGCASDGKNAMMGCRGGAGEDFVGGDAFAVDVEGGDVESTLANPAMTEVRAFMPRVFRRGRPRITEVGSPTRGVGRGAGQLLRDVTHFDLMGQYAWFYPDPPWGRKDVFRRGSKFLQVWHVIVWIAMVHVALVVPYRVAGFDHDTVFTSQQSTSLLWECGKSARTAVDSVVDLIFLLDMVLAPLAPHPFPPLKASPSFRVTAVDEPDPLTFLAPITPQRP